MPYIAIVGIYLLPPPTAAQQPANQQPEKVKWQKLGQRASKIDHLLLSSSEPAIFEFAPTYVEEIYDEKIYSTYLICTAFWCQSAPTGTYRVHRYR